MSNDKLALLYMQDGIKHSWSSNWIWNKKHCEEVAGRTVDMTVLAGKIWWHFGDYILDMQNSEGEIDCVLAGSVCDYMHFPHNYDSWVEACKEEYGETADVSREAWECCNKGYERCQAYIKKLEKEL